MIWDTQSRDKQMYQPVMVQILSINMVSKRAITNLEYIQWTLITMAAFVPNTEFAVVLNT